MPHLTPLNYGGYVAHYSADLGVAPYFQTLISKRLHDQLAINCVVTGEAGISKSYTAWAICRVFSKGKFTTDQIVSSYAEYMRELLAPRSVGVPIGFDEPQYAIDKRDWYNQVNKSLVKTVTSQRFRLRPVFIPIINLNLLDKVLRSYLIQYHIHIYKRGEGAVYQLEPSQFEDKLYRSRICRIQYGLFDRECGIDSCLTCKSLDTCEEFRAKYERKKAGWMEERDTGELAQAEKKELEQELTTEVLLKHLYDNLDKIRRKTGVKRLDTDLMRGLLKEKTGIVYGRDKVLNLRGLLLYDHPELLPEVVEKGAK